MENKKNYQTEQSAQATYWLLFKFGNLLYFILAAAIGLNGSAAIGVCSIVLQVAFNVAFVPKKLAEFYERLRVVAFKQQVMNLYVFSNHPNDNDVLQRFEEAFTFLKKVGNKHGVTVYMVIFHDACIFSSRWKSNGQRHDERKWRDAGSTYESWADYLSFCQAFQLKDNEERVKALRADDKGRDWVNELVYGQAVSDDENQRANER